MEEKGRNSYWYYPEKDMKFENRKEVKKFVGRYKFDKLLKEKKVVYVLFDDKK